MALTGPGRAALTARVHAFLDETRRDIGIGNIEAVVARYARPLVLVHDGWTEVLMEEEALRGHVERVAELSASGEPIWRQDIVDIQTLDRVLLSVTADVHRIDTNAHPLPVVRQTLVLRRLGETFQYAAILNPIRHHKLHQDTLAQGDDQTPSERDR